MKKGKDRKPEKKVPKKTLSKSSKKLLASAKKKRNVKKKIAKTESGQRKKRDFSLPWLEGLFFFLIFISLGLLFVLGGRFFTPKSASPDRLRQIETADSAVIKGSLTEASQKIVEQKKELDTPKIDTANWKTYSNSWYGFSLKYPPNWKPPVAVNPSPVNRNSNSTARANPEKWEKKYFFAPSENESSDSVIGFDLFVYDIKKVGELRNTSQFPLVKPSFSENPISCNLDIGGHLIESERFSAEEIYVPLNDKCLENTFYFFLTSEDHIFNLVPRYRNDFTTENNLKNEVILSLPDFFGVAETLELIDIKRPAPKPKITAPMPASFKVVNGRLVCDKKNDKPSRSDKTKHRHLDMECCLDPDEYPNPHCYYDPAKYGKYLK